MSDQPQPQSSSSTTATTAPPPPPPPPPPPRPKSTSRPTTPTPGNSSTTASGTFAPPVPKRPAPAAPVGAADNGKQEQQQQQRYQTPPTAPTLPTPPANSVDRRDESPARAGNTPSEQQAPPQQQQLQQQKSPTATTTPTRKAVPAAPSAAPRKSSPVTGSANTRPAAQNAASAASNRAMPPPPAPPPPAALDPPLDAEKVSETTTNNIAASTTSASATWSPASPPGEPQKPQVGRQQQAVPPAPPSPPTGSKSQSNSRATTPNKTTITTATAGATATSSTSRPTTPNKSNNKAPPVPAVRPHAASPSSSSSPATPETKKRGTTPPPPVPPAPTASQQQQQQQQQRSTPAANRRSDSATKGANSRSGSNRSSSNAPVDPHAIPPAPSFEEERLALLRHLREVPRQATHATSTDPPQLASAASSPLKAPPIPLKPGQHSQQQQQQQKPQSAHSAALERALAVEPTPRASTIHSGASTAAGTATAESACGPDPPSTQKPCTICPLLNLQLDETNARNALEHGARDDIADLSSECWRGLFVSERARRNELTASSNSINSLVIALEEAQQQSAHAADRLQETYDVLERMSAELSDSRTMTLQVQAELTQTRDQHAAVVEQMRLEFDIERDSWMQRAEAQFMKRVKKLASRVASQEQELIELRGAIGSLRAISAAPGGSELALRLVEDAILASDPAHQSAEQQQHQQNLSGGANHAFAQHLNANARHSLLSSSSAARRDDNSASRGTSANSNQPGATTNINITHNHNRPAPDPHFYHGAASSASAVSPPRLNPALNLRGGVGSGVGTGGTKRLFESGVLDAESATVKRLIEKGYLSPP